MEEHTPIQQAESVWPLAWLRQLRDELKTPDDFNVIDHPEEWGVLWRRIEAHLVDVSCIINDIIRVHEGIADSDEVEGGTLDTAVVRLEQVASDVKDFADRIDDFMSAGVERLRADMRVVG